MHACSGLSWVLGTQGLQVSTEALASEAPAKQPVLGDHHVLRMRLQEVALRCGIACGAWQAALQAARSLSGTYQLLYPPVRGFVSHASVDVLPSNVRMLATIGRPAYGVCIFVLRGPPCAIRRSSIHPTQHSHLPSLMPAPIHWSTRMRLDVTDNLYIYICMAFGWLPVRLACCCCTGSMGLLAGVSLC